jgi:hypothetical protein
MVALKRRSLLSLVCTTLLFSTHFPNNSYILTSFIFTVPGILSQLGPDSLASLRKLAEAYQSAQGSGNADDDDEIPELVENFDKAEISEVTEEEKAE